LHTSWTISRALWSKARTCKKWCTAPALPPKVQLPGARRMELSRTVTIGMQTIAPRRSEVLAPVACVPRVEQRRLVANPCRSAHLPINRRSSSSSVHQCRPRPTRTFALTMKTATDTSRVLLRSLRMTEVRTFRRRRSSSF